MSNNPAETPSVPKPALAATPELNEGTEAPRRWP